MEPAVGFATTARSNIRVAVIASLTSDGAALPRRWRVQISFSPEPHQKWFTCDETAYQEHTTHEAETTVARASPWACVIEYLCPSDILERFGHVRQRRCSRGWHRCRHTCQPMLMALLEVCPKTDTKPADVNTTTSRAPALDCALTFPLSGGKSCARQF